MENEFHQWLQENLPSDPRQLVGIGDDAAVLDWLPEANCVVTSDMLADNVHFKLSEVGAARVGRKCLAVNLSDIAAMAAKPIAAVVSFLLPQNSDKSLARELYAGMLPLAKDFDTIIAGGDTNTWNGDLVVNVTALGSVDEVGPLRRDGASPGDAVFVTGSLGGSILGHHLDFTPRIREAQQLHRIFKLTAGLDISDGLALDAFRLANGSQCGIEFDLAAIPISSSAHQMATNDPTRTALDRALSDGEDFELLFTMRSDSIDLLAEWNEGTPITRIGTCIAQSGLWQTTAEGKRAQLQPQGYEH